MDTAPSRRPTLAFLGRIDEPRKGLPVLAAAMPAVLAQHPGARVLVAGPGDVEAARERLDPAVAAATEFLGMVSDEDKAALLSSVDLYVAPHTGGESFGIVLVEAMSAGAPGGGQRPAGLRPGPRRGPGRGDVRQRGQRRPGATAAPPARRPGGARAARRRLGSRRAWVFDWSVVAEDVMAVYETVTHGCRRDAPVASRPADTRWTRLLRGAPGR